MAKQAEVKSERIDTLVSVIGVLDGSVVSAADLVLRLEALLDDSYTNYEILLVDNGVRPEELVAVRGLLAKVPCVRILRLSKHHTHDAAVFAGLESAIGDYVVVFSPAFDPIAAIPEIVDLNRGGSDIVQGLSSESLGGKWYGRFGRTVFYWYNRRFLGIEIPSRATYLTSLTRRAVNSLTSGERNHRYLRHLLQHIGFTLTPYRYTPAAGNSKRRTVKAGAVEAMEMISSYSTHPLRVVTFLGVVAALLNLLYAVYVVVVNVIQADIAPGWTTTSLQLSLMFFFICTMIAVQSEYIGRILTETRREPGYVVMEELESEILISNLHRRNVSD